MSVEQTKAFDTAHVAVEVPTHQPIQWRAHARVDKYDDEATRWVRNKLGIVQPDRHHFRQLKVQPFEVTEQPGNLLTTVGLARLTSLLIGGGGQALTNTACRTGVGNGAGTAAIGDTALSASAGSANQFWQIMVASYPQVSNGVITFQSTFGTGDGNFTAGWTEWGIAVGTPTVASNATLGSDLLFNHKTSAALGTKVAGSTWTLTTTITIS